MTGSVLIFLVVHLHSCYFSAFSETEGKSSVMHECRLFKFTFSWLSKTHHTLIQLSRARLPPLHIGDWVKHLFFLRAGIWKVVFSFLNSIISPEKRIPQNVYENVFRLSYPRCISSWDFIELLSGVRKTRNVSQNSCVVVNKLRRDYFSG